MQIRVDLKLFLICETFHRQNVSSFCDASVATDEALLLKAAAVYQHPNPAGVSRRLSSPSFLSRSNKLSPSPASLHRGSCPAQLLPLQRQQGPIGNQEGIYCITRTYYDDEMSYKVPNTLLKKSLSL